MGTLGPAFLRRGRAAFPVEARYYPTCVMLFVALGQTVWAKVRGPRNFWGVIMTIPRTF